MYNKSIMGRLVKYVLAIIVLLIFFSYRLTKVPAGLTIDEASFGYNGILLSETLHDENDRFLPIFVLSIGGTDWRQPITQYFIAGVFRIFRASVFNLRFTSVIVAVVSILLAYKLGEMLMGKLGGILFAIFLATTPIVMIHAHLGLDNLMPLPFIFGWLIFLLKFREKTDYKFLMLSAISLGIGFYSYKGIRVFIPTWCVLTILYLFLSSASRRKDIFSKTNIRKVLVFSLSILPFFAIIPLLEYKYAGAVLNRTSFEIKSIYNFISLYLSSFDPSFLFIKGDEMLHHSTGMHGMLLLASLPIFIIGLTRVSKKDTFWKLIITSLLLGPLLYGFVGPAHRASRLISMVPMYVLISTLGAKWLIEKSRNTKIVFAVLSILVVVNYFDFVKHYWFAYADETRHSFYQLEAGDAYKALKEEAEGRGLTPIVHDLIAGEESEADRFLRSISFLELPPVWKGDLKEYPDDGLLMTNDPEIEGLGKLEIESGNYYYYEKL